MLPGQRQDVSGRKGAQKNFSASEKNFSNRVISVIILSKHLLDSLGLNPLHRCLLHLVQTSREGREGQGYHEARRGFPRGVHRD